MAVDETRPGDTFMRPRTCVRGVCVCVITPVISVVPEIMRADVQCVYICLSVCLFVYAYILCVCVCVCTRVSLRANKYDN